MCSPHDNKLEALGAFGAKFYCMLCESAEEVIWKSAYVDIRWTSESGTRISKCRIIDSDGQVKTLLGTVFERVPVKIQLELHAVWNSQRHSKNPWYGLVFNLYKNGSHNVVMNYDPECAGESSFFDE